MATNYSLGSSARVRSFDMLAISRRVILSSLLTGLLSLNACSSVIDNLGFDGLEAPEFGTTAMSAATGGAIGAGLGLIIGSTTGDAGEGLLIGTGVGALAGAAVGAEIQAQDDILISHKATISRQEEEIRQQKDVIERIKGGGVDVSSYDNGRFVIPEGNRSSVLLWWECWRYDKFHSGVCKYTNRD